MSKQPEVWMRGPLPGMAPLVQPVAFALLQVREELDVLMDGFPDDQLFETVAGMASVAFHLQHLTGVLDRLFTYARNERLSETQLEYLAAEGKMNTKIYTASQLVEKFNLQVDEALAELKQVEEVTLTDFRGVGRAGLPSTKMGLYVHAAEHTTRHFGQLLVTVKVLQSTGL
ncbi:metal-dependent hydrolase [Mucilaginibacter sp. PAMC 26640]|nr:metal-dependent hydrolase [Mucilaginibacter sp. PAMC 26640]